ncbi:MAG: DUF488 domain-containing protein [Boseongicola sp. SB0677_bin_26]|nr:DUF488 domain-containing protein [Boseongicola sp. SB0665_bin_10]MYG26497.1 DUF488 domain-containing protein [Boseongicola sp. SB0677_bin_26]
MSEIAETILTVGHSNHDLEFFVGLLDAHCVTALVDVRSSPYSRFNSQFNRERLAESLKGSGISYVYLGRELGGRSDDRSHYERGRIRYDRLSNTARFRDGLERIVRGAEDYRIALMCAEKEPLDCHRTLLVGHELDRLGVDVAHILPDKPLEPHADAMDRLLAKFGLDDYDLINRDEPRMERVRRAIDLQAKNVGHAVERESELAEMEAP